MSLRAEKIASVIRHTVAQPISDIAREYNKGSLVTVTTIKVSKDLSIAKIYISVLAGKLSPQEMVDVLTKRGKQIRHHLARVAQFKFTPQLKFFLDDTLEQMDNIQKLIDSTKD